MFKNLIKTTEDENFPTINEINEYTKYIIHLNLLQKQNNNTYNCVNHIIQLENGNK